jgi:hypothetical protein
MASSREESMQKACISWLWRFGFRARKACQLLVSDVILDVLSTFSGGSEK